MKEELAIRLEAWFDGEVSATEAAEIESFLEGNSEARAYVDQLRQTRQALQSAYVPDVDASAVWESHKERLSAGNRDRPANIFSFPRMVTSIAAILVIGMALWLPIRKMGTSSDALELDSVVQMVETDLEGATPIVYLDQPSGWTVVWVVEAEEPT